MQNAVSSCPPTRPGPSPRTLHQHSRIRHSRIFSGTHGPPAAGGNGAPSRRRRWCRIRLHSGCQLCGAQVIGTASTDERRSYVLGAGADHVLDSRSLNFVDDVRELTGGRGVDVVVTAAPLEILCHSFDAIAEPGRIVEIAKPGIYTGGMLEMMLFEKNVTYFSVDLDRMMSYGADEFLVVASEVFEKFVSGTYQPLPVKVFATAELAEATEEAFRSERIGRMAVRLTDDAPAVKPALPEVVTDPAVPTWSPADTAVSAWRPDDGSSDAAPGIYWPAEVVRQQISPQAARPVADVWRRCHRRTDRHHRRCRCRRPGESLPRQRPSAAGHLPRCGGGGGSESG